MGIMLSKKLIILSAVLFVGGLPSLARIEGMVSKNHFYDNEKTIMTEMPQDKTIKTEKYWEKNLFYFNKYRPLFMLSNKELYDLTPKEETYTVKRVIIPSVYNISLKIPSIKNVSLPVKP
ncbi:MAG: hypothetical protein PHC64_08475, partial [Candidatus Gastranaerophilales bacterium]|nr:hypothetical protein [Candidatus Gastranaerophilales bacterium]